MTSFLWHDYETWGVSPALDKPAQFAAIRTDADLNPIGEPLMWYCKPASDCLPHPEAVLITGITPQKAWRQGLLEADFMRNIHAQMMLPGTCTVGFNSIRFDDEVTRFGLFRNFHDPYEREYKNGNSRFDIIDVVRLCAAVRPEGIEWPVDENGVPSYKLERLTAANGIAQVGAHDALVDVEATIAVARLVKNAQPKLFDYALTLRNKGQVAKILNVGAGKPVLHISGMFGSINYCTSMVLPLCMHPSNKNAVICYDLREDPSDFLQLSVEDIRLRIFSSQQELGDTKRIALKSIHMNKCPMVAPAKMLSDDVAQRANLDHKLLRKHYDALLANKDAWQKASEVFIQQTAMPERDVEASLYSGGFLSPADKALCQQVCEADVATLQNTEFSFSDSRLQTLLLRYKGRNYPESLTETELLQWQDWRFQRLTDASAGASICLEEYQLKLELLFEQYQSDEAKLQLLAELMNWSDSLLG